MNKCAKCGKAYEPSWIHFGAGKEEKPSGRLVIECGREKISKTLPLCQECTEKVMDALTRGITDAVSLGEVLTFVNNGRFSTPKSMPKAYEDGWRDACKSIEKTLKNFFDVEYEEVHENGTN